MQTRPARNDVVIRQKCIGRVTWYVLKTPSCPDQILVASRDAAVAHALAFARFAHLCAWMDDASGRVLLGSFRAVAHQAPLALRAGL
jgi:hypothetical protein